ncbi:MAG: ABC transporter substrate-binding protein [Candidatus Synechococcus spongiarum 142]|uniref:ABC transporter substrate-binding protein n=1 Tax=Candidatus Synechococcus spongiarum 142 TaxID=1608213 RepID=A0A6N3XBR0_9SYNE|nr:MAG: ABC transporter substrate-binding protein [Candidatus Synechococcus spongiarum 142]
MKRRQVITTAAFGLGSATLAACGGQGNKQRQISSPTVIGGDQPRIRWRLATSWPKSLDTMYGGAVAVAERVGEMSDGYFEITPHAAGELVPGLKVLDAVQEGSAECGHTASYYYIDKNPAFAFGSAVPFGLSTQQQNAWFYEGGGNEAMNRLFGKFDVLGFPAGNTGPQMGGWFKQRVNTVADLQGLKMRIPGLGGEVMSTLGVHVQALPGGEIFSALEEGAIDAAEWVGPYDDEKLGLQKVAKYYYHPGWWEPGTALHIFVHRKTWDALPKAYQHMFRTAASEVNLQMLARYDERNGDALRRLVAEGTTLVPYSDSILKSAEQASFEIYEDHAIKNQEFRRIYEPWSHFRENILHWSNVKESMKNTLPIALRTEILRKACMSSVRIF